MNENAEKVDASDQIRGQFSWKIIPVALVTAGIMYVLVGHLGDLEEFGEAIRNAKWEWFSLAIGLMGINLLFGGWRFQVVLKAIGYKLSLRRSIEVLLAVWPFALVTPSRANDLLRALALRKRVPMLSCAGSVIAERLIDIQTLCLLGMLGCAVMGEWLWFGLLLGIWGSEWLTIIILVTAFERVLTIPFVDRFEKKLRALFHAFDALRERPKYLVRLVGISMLAWSSALTNLWLLLWIFNTPLPPEVVLGFWPLAIFVGILPMTIGGLGTRDAAFAGLLWTTGWVGAEAAVLAATFSYGLVTFILPATSGIPFMLRHLWRIDK